MLNLTFIPNSAVSAKSNVGMDCEIVQYEHDLKVYKTIVFLSKRDVLYTKLNQQFKRVEGRVINIEYAVYHLGKTK